MKKDFQDQSVARAKNRIAALHHVILEILLILKNPVNPVHLIFCRLPVLRSCQRERRPSGLCCKPDEVTCRAPGTMLRLGWGSS